MAERKHWRVSVETSGDTIVSIEPEMLAGREISDEDEELIRTAAHHLLSFIGDPTPAPQSRVTGLTPEKIALDDNRDLAILVREFADLLQYASWKEKVDEEEAEALLERSEKLLDDRSVSTESPLNEPDALGGTAMTDTLSPCPFCNCEAAIEKSRFGRPVMTWVKCSCCGASSTAFNKAEDAIAAWNNRSSPASTTHAASHPVSGAPEVEG